MGVYLTNVLFKVKITVVMPEISVIIPTYNRSCIIREAIDSVLNQNYKNYEIIVVDDGSTDDTYSILEKYNGRIRYVFQNNGGVGKARNTGIRLAKGNFIAFLDSDDLWDPEKLSFQLNFFRGNPGAYISYTKETWLKNNIRINQPQIYMPTADTDIISKLLNRCFIGASSVMVKRELFGLVGYFNEFFPVCEDLDLWLRMAVKYPIYFIDRPLTVKRMGEWPQLSTSVWGMDRYRISIYEAILKTNHLNSSQRQQFLDIINRKSYILVKGSIKHKHPILTVRYGWKWLKYLNIKKLI